MTINSLDVDCPFCGQAVSFRCVTASGKTCGPHWQRQELAISTQTIRDYQDKYRGRR